ncbi:hypothetical protein LT85_2324 [Collimonas arenae]|uniref:Uncharacterized protein n=2 Tax=Collimonas arenae TaxID=279058 RepID=A0A0A1FF55_9BURK|nr:hypothetical protein LT85_2324 [Collimonas arenae]
MLETHAYALINPLQVDPANWQDLPTIPVVPASFQSQPELFPVLLKLNDLEPAVRIALLSRAETWEHGSDYPWFSALLDTPAPAEQIQQHLASCMELHQLTGEVDLIRIHDPRTFRHLRWLLDEQQLAALLGPVNTWSWREPNGQWRNHRNTTRSATVFQLSLQQQHQLLRLGEVNATLQHLTRVAPNLHDDDALARRIDILLAEAWHTHLLADQTDRQLYAIQALRFHPDIHQHPFMRKRLEQVHAEAISYVGACAELDEPAMHRFAEELRISKDRT